MLSFGACSPGAVRVTPPRVESAVARTCADLVRALPRRVIGAPRREVRPDSQLTAAWGDPPVVLRCGVARPAGLSATSDVIEIRASAGGAGVAWFLRESQTAYRFTSVGRAAYVEVTVPAKVPREEATGPLVDLGAAVTRADPPA